MIFQIILTFLLGPGFTQNTTTIMTTTIGGSGDDGDGSGDNGDGDTTSEYTFVILVNELIASDR